MKLSSDDLYTSGTYFERKPTFDATDSAWKAEVISKLLKRNKIMAKEMVEVGCGAGGILENLSKSHQEISFFNGFDISPQAIILAKKKESERIKFFEKDYTTLSTPKTSVLLLIDVLEHIDDYYGMLRKLKERSDYFVFHVPLDLSCRSVLKPHIMLQQRETVGHVHYFTRNILQWALTDIGYTTIDWVYTKPITDTFAPRGTKGKIKKVLRNMAFTMNKNLTADLFGGYSLMILAK